MKLITKSIIGIGTAASIAAAITLPIVLKKNDNNIIFSQKKFDEYSEISISKNFNEYNDNKDTILETANSADINMYFNSAISPFTNMMRLSMLSTKENHFYLKRNGNNSYEDKVDMTKLKNFYNSGRSNHSNTKSAVEGFSGNTFSASTKALKSMKKIILENPSKKINIWWNASGIHGGNSDNQVLTLAGFKNVNIQLIEDGSSNKFGGAVDQKISENKFDPNSREFQNIFSAPFFVPGTIKSWVSDKGGLHINDLSDKTFDIGNYFEYKTLSDLIFQTRDSSGSRLSGEGTDIMGVDGKNAADIVSAATEKNGKKSLIVIGSYGVSGEESGIKDVWNRYHGKYNIFYKGHPGHMDHPLFVENGINKEHPDSMYQLEPMISSEELTAHHVVPETGKVPGEKYIQFDKVAVVGRSAAITKSAFPNLDITKDVIECYLGNGKYIQNPSEVPQAKGGDGMGVWLSNA